MSSPTPVVIGRYRIIRSLGVGGMGAVFLARDPAIDRLVAIKLMRQGFEVAQMRDRFTREAQSIGRLHHPNVVTIFDVGEHDGAPFIAMEYVEGQTLGGLIRHDPDIPLSRKIALMDGLCAGLHYAHRSGIVHRDIKPANVMVDTEGVAKILDFGIARGVTAGLTQAGTVLGTLNYMSPEQLGGKVVDHRADIFSVGAVFYELLSGKLAFPGDVSSGVLQVILVGKPEALTTYCPGLDADVIAIVDRCIEKEADRRYKDLEAMRKDLAAIRRRLEDPAQVPDTMPMPRVREGGSDSRPVRTPGPDTRAELARLRRERIDQHLNDARKELAKGEFTAAREACRQALIVDPDNPDVPEIQDQIELAEQARQLLADAEDQLGKGALTAASMLVGRVLSTNPKLPQALRVRDAVADARRKLEDMQRRQRALEDAIERARQHVSTDQFDLAEAAIEEATAIEPAHDELQTLKRDLTSRRDAKRKREDEARAQQAVDEAQARFAAGEHAPAIAALKAFAPAMPLVRDAIVALEVEWRDITRRAEEQRRQQEARRKQEEEEEARRREEARLKEEDTRRKEEEARRKAEEAERRRQQEEEKKEEKKKEEKKKADERRLADERKAAAAPDTVIQVPGAAKTAPLQVKPAAPASPAAAKTAVHSAADTMPLPREITANVRDIVGKKKDEAPPRPKTGLFVAVGLAVVAVGLVVWALTSGSKPETPPPVPVPPGLVQVMLDVRPWAEIEITNKAGQVVGGSAKLETPCLVPLEPGEYHVRARNTIYPMFEFDITVEAGKGLLDVKKVFPQLNAAEEAKRILTGK